MTYNVLNKNYNSNSNNNILDYDRLVDGARFNMESRKGSLNSNKSKKIRLMEAPEFENNREKEDDLIVKESDYKSTLTKEL